MNTAEYIIKKLEELGVNDFFGIPNEYNMNLLYAVENNPNTNWIGCTNEQNAGHSADGYARIRGYGALITSFGSGELSSISAIAGSMAENVPVINIVGLPATKVVDNKNQIHNFDCIYFIDVYKNVVASTAILNRDNAKLEIDRILKILVREKKPVYIAIPADIALMEISDRVVSYDWISDRTVLEELGSKIAEKINNSQSPVIIGDVLIKRFDAEIEYKEFVEKSKIPVSNFIMGTNIVDMDYEKYIGGYFGKYKNPIAQKHIEETDCLIAVGVIRNNLNSYGHLPYDINNHVAIYGNYAYVDGERFDNVKMSELLEEVSKYVKPRDVEVDKCNIGFKDIIYDNEKLTSNYLYSRIQEFVKDNDIIISGAGTIPFGLAQMKFPASVDLQLQMSWAASGWATPALLGACIAKPQSRVVLVVGEGTHQAAAIELGALLRYGLKPVVIVINNGGYTALRMLSKTSDCKFNDIMQINYTKFARTFDGDVWATKVTTAEDFDKALKVTQIMNKMCYIEACIEPLDVLPLVKMVFEDKKNNVQNIDVPETGISDNLIENDNYLYRTEDVQYETVVHKVLTDDSEEEDE